MATSSSFAEIIKKDFLNCKLCFEKYYNPKALPCLHTYCEECLRKLVPHKTKVFQCPECREEVILSKGGISNLRTNFYINDLLNALQLNEKIDKMCNVCPPKWRHDRPAVTECLDCPSFMCQLCTNKHLSTLSQHHHRVLMLSATSCDALKLVTKVWQRPTLRCSFNTELHRDSYTPKLTGVSMLRKGDIILVDEANGTLKSYSIDGSFRMWFSVADTDKDPCSVTVCGDQIAYSADGQLYIVELNGDLVKQLLLKGSEPSYPITAYKDEYLVVSEGTLCSLSLYNLDGQAIDRVKPRGYQGNRFLFVAVSSQENFIVSDVGKKCLVIFTRSGDVLRVCDEILMQGVPRCLNPFGVCVDKYDNIYVSEPGCIISFSPTGIFKREMLAAKDGIKSLAP
eukprot:gi/632982189/ref/XP_007908000.1/ PREDICTED: uncharacterized protein LOC103189419 [Callorhinchus milii]